MAWDSWTYSPLSITFPKPDLSPPTWMELSVSSFCLSLSVSMTQIFHWLFGLPLLTHLEFIRNWNPQVGVPLVNLHLPQPVLTQVILKKPNNYLLKYVLQTDKGKMGTTFTCHGCLCDPVLTLCNQYITSIPEAILDTQVIFSPEVETLNWFCWIWVYYLSAQIIWTLNNILRFLC